MHAHRHTHMHIHAHTHACTHTYTHTYTHTHTHTHTHTQTHTHCAQTHHTPCRAASNDNIRSTFESFGSKVIQSSLCDTYPMEIEGRSTVDYWLCAVWAYIHTPSIVSCFLQNMYNYIMYIQCYRSYNIIGYA